ncbi:hypothetical protein DFH09DRAFT_1354880 [Mycena vulgaris]|nr:hypothetical protein DFH09DRAFT_1354880 [Mycena vulgaris]
MSNVENAPITRTTRSDSPWNPPMFFDSDLMDVDLHYEFDLEKDYGIELQYPHIPTPDFHDSSKPSPPPVSESDVFTSSTANNHRPSIFSSLARLPSHFPINPTAPNAYNTPQAIDPPTPSSVDYAMQTPADFSISSHEFKDAITPFGHKFELADDWIVSGSYVSPVIHARNRMSKPIPSSPPIMSFLDRLQAHSSFSSSSSNAVPPRHAKNRTRSPLPLLSPCKLTASLANNSANKENLIHVQRRAQYSPLTVSASAPRRPIPIFPFSRSRLTPSRLQNTPFSPLTPLTPSPNASTSLSLHSASTSSIPLAAARKRRLSTSESPTTRIKRTRYSLSGEDAPILGEKRTASPVFSTRTLPAHFVVSPAFPLFYRRFPASTYLRTGASGSPCALFGKPHPGGVYNPPRDPFDLYTPRFVKGRAADKMGLCPICIEAPERGGEGKKVWLGMKFSAFKWFVPPLLVLLSLTKYHHGISATTARPLSPPTAFRVVARPSPRKSERAAVTQGKCHKCRSWIVIETVKDMDVKVKELIWWKHAVACHAAPAMGERDVFEEDEVYAVLRKIAVAAPADTA